MASGARAGLGKCEVSAMNADAQKKPTPLEPNFETFPAELKPLPNWVLWRYLPPKSSGGKWRKVPFQPNGKTAKTTDRSTWSRFEECCAAYAQGAFDGVGFVFDGEIGADGLCYCGVHFDACVHHGTKVDSLALRRINRLNTYTELSVSGTGFHCIVRAEPLDRIVKFDGVEVYTKARFFTFTGSAVREIKAAAAEVRALVDEVRAKQAAAKRQQQLGRSGSKGVPSTELQSYKNEKLPKIFSKRDPGESLGAGIKTSQWFELLSPEQKDEVVDCALATIAKQTRLLEIEADGGNNAEYYKLTTAVARSGAPNAEDIFVKHASTAKNADPDEELRQHFSRCSESHLSSNRAISVGTLLHIAQEHGANFDPWKCMAPNVTALPLVTWSAAELKVSFSNIPHRRWLYGIDLVRGEITVQGAPGGAGKTSLAIGMAVSIATGRALLEETIWGGDKLKALYINAEDSSIEMQRRVWAFCLKHGITEQDLDGLYIAGTDDARVQALSFLRTTDKNSFVLDQSGFKCLEELVNSLHPDLMVIDPLVALCGGGNINDNGAMSLVIRELKRLAIKFDCAILIIHHTRKGGEAGSAEAISGAAAIVNLARRAIMPVTMTEDETTKLRVWPSQRHAYFKVVDAKSNLAPRSDDTPWYRLDNVTLPNAEPPTYEFGDRVQAVERVQLPLLNHGVAAADDEIIRHAILDTVDRGKMIEGEVYPYSPNVSGAKNERTLLDDAMTAVEKASDRLWPQGDLQAVVKRTVESLKSEKWLVSGDEIKGRRRFRRGSTLRVDWARTPWAEAHRAPAAHTMQTRTDETAASMKD
jgi:AAA domain